MVASVATHQGIDGVVPFLDAARPSCTTMPALSVTVGGVSRTERVLSWQCAMQIRMISEPQRIGGGPQPGRLAAAMDVFGCAIRSQTEAQIVRRPQCTSV
jgi:hypothetical protein